MTPVVIVGGLDRLERHYEETAKKLGYEARIFNSFRPNLPRTLRYSHGVIMFTNLISHNMAKIVVTTARDNSVPVVRSHKCSISALKKCLSELKTIEDCRACEGRGK